MPTLFGKNWNRQQIQKYTGAPWQAGSIRHMRFVEGTEDGTDVVQFDTGTGLYFNVLPQRGLDISTAKYQGASLALEMPAGEAHPSFLDPRGLGWLKSFYVGLITTCGMTWAGAPCNDQGEELGLHGRISHLPSRNLKISDEWVGNDRILSVSGEIRESVLFGPHLLLKRKISTIVGSNTIILEDTVRNEGFEKTPHQMLYHINIGFPVVDEETMLLADSKVKPRDAEAEKGIDAYNTFEAPQPGYKEQCFYHEVKQDSKGFCDIALVNPAFNQGQGLGIHLRYRKNELHRFAQWKNMMAGGYVCGLEPCNCSVQGRAHDRDDKSLIFLNPGEERNYYLELTVLPDNEAIQEMSKLMGKK